jgi:hypothetical protein
MKIMSHHSSATERDETPHTINSTNPIISDALKRRAQSVINDKSIDGGTRAFIHYALEINDPWLPELVRRVDAGETIIDNLNLPLTSEEKIEALAEMICRAGDEPSAALLVLMATLENAPHPKALTNTAKHFAFTRCVELNLYGMVDAQIAVLEGELLAANSLAA